LSDAPDAAEIARINAEHLITTPLRPADLLFIFGTRHGVAETVDATVDSGGAGFSAMPCERRADPGDSVTDAR